jgi:transposase-like protein
MDLVPVNCKQLILEDAKKGILKNHSLEEIAIHHGISKRTLKKWLMSLSEEHQDLRQLWIDNMVAEAKEETENVVNNFPVARTNAK